MFLPIIMFTFMIIANGEYSEHYLTNMYAQTISSQFWVMFYDENKVTDTP